MVTAKDVNELLANSTKKEFLDSTIAETELLDYRSKVLVSHIWIELLMECIIMKKFKNHEDLIDFDFSKKQKILFGLGIINGDMNHELKIFNRIRNVFAHEIDPMDGKVTNLIKQFKLNPKIKTNKESNLLTNAWVDGAIAGTINGILTRYLVDIIWEIQSKEEKIGEYNQKFMENLEKMYDEQNLESKKRLDAMDRAFEKKLDEIDRN